MAEIHYTKDHEYIRVEDEDGVVGISEHAQQQLGDVVFAEAPPIGKKLKKGDPAAVVESVKAASDVFAPASGEVVAVNSEVEFDAGPHQRGCAGQGVALPPQARRPGRARGLMDEAAYAEYVKSLGLTPCATCRSIRANARRC